MSDAREGRGAGNGKGENWYNSPLWDNIEKKKDKSNMTRIECSVFELADYKNMNLMVSHDGKNFSKFLGDERTLMRCLLEMSLYTEKPKGDD